MKAIIYADGASSGNLGDAGTGIDIYLKDKAIKNRAGDVVAP